jgi:DNA-binding NtrC family response regulator
MPPRLPNLADAVARVVFVDADSERAQLLTKAISGCLLHEPAVVMVGNGREAVDVLRGGPFDIAIVDLMTLADLGATPEDSIPRLVKVGHEALIVALSHDASVSAAVGVMRAGAHDCIATSVTPAALASRISQLAARHGKGHLFGADAPLRQTLDNIAELARASSQALGIGVVIGGSGEQQLQQLSRRLSALFENGAGEAHAGSAVTSGPNIVLPMWQQEQRIIEQAIASFAGNVGMAAQALELSPSTIYRKRQAWAEMETRKGAA